MAEYLAYRVLGGVAQACCSVGFVQCAGGCGTTSKLGSRLADLLLFYLFSALGLALLFYGGTVLEFLTSLGLVDCEGKAEAVCIGAFTVYRLCCALVIYHCLMLLANLAGPQLSDAVENGYLLGRIVLVCLLVMGSFFIGNTAFAWFRDAAKIVSIAFLLVQSVFLIDFAYEWNETWLERYNSSEDSRFWGCWLFTFATTLLGLGVVLTVLNYMAVQDCGIALTSSILGTLAVVVMLGMSLLPYFENGCKRLFSHSDVLIRQSVLYLPPMERHPQSARSLLVPPVLYPSQRPSRTFLPVHFRDSHGRTHFQRV